MNQPKFIKEIQKSYKNIRKKKDEPIKYIAIPLHKIGITPNMVSFFGFLCALFAVYFLFNNHFLFIIFYLLNFLSDFVDGTLARISKINNPKGPYIDAGIDAAFGIMLLIKAFFHFGHPLILIPLLIYVWEGRKLENWASGFYPNITWLKVAFVFKLFYFGLVLQTCVSVFNITMRKVFNLKLDPKSI